MEEKQVLKEENNRLEKEVKEQKQGVTRMERALNYVEEQLTTLRAAPPQQPQRSQQANPSLLSGDTMQFPPPSGTPSNSISSGRSRKTMKISDPPIFDESEK